MKHIAVSVTAIAILLAASDPFVTAKPAIDVDSPHFPRPLSPLAATIYRRVLSSILPSPRSSPIPVDLIATSARVDDHVIDYDDKRTFADDVYYPAITSAEEELL